MLPISKRSEYGILFLIYLNQFEKNNVSLTKAAEDLQLPYRFLSHIATDLKNAQLIESREGVKGGYQLSKQLNEVSLKDIVSLLDGEWGVVRCMQGKQCDRVSRCSLQKSFGKVQSEVETIFKKYTLADFVLNQDLRQS